MTIRITQYLTTQVGDIAVFVPVPSGFTWSHKKHEEYEIQDFIVRFEGQLDEVTFRDITLKTLCALDVRKVNVENTYLEITCSSWHGRICNFSPEKALEDAVQKIVPDIIRKLAVFGLEGYSVFFLENPKARK